MGAAVDLQLPGVYFRPPPPAASGLPLLDVAAFVGFAERGPLHTPVVVGDVGQYRAVFGGDLPLAREASGEVVHACLPTSVAAFFANGGRRCHVVRVAGPEASATRFRVPGLIVVDQRGAARLASVRASSPGRWSARLRLAARLLATPLPLEAFVPAVAGGGAAGDGGDLLWHTGGAPLALQRGDVLRLTLDDATTWLVGIEDVRRPAGTGPVSLFLGKAWRLTLPEAMAPAGVVALHRLGLDRGRTLEVEASLRSEMGAFGLEITGAEKGVVERGDVLDLRLEDHTRLLFAVEAVVAQTGAVAARADSLLHLPAVTLAASSLESLRRIDRLRFDLLLWEKDRQHPTLSELGFAPGHPRFWGEAAFLESTTLPRSGAERSGSLLAASILPEAPATRAARLFYQMLGDERYGAGEEGALDVVALSALLAPLEPAGAADGYLPVGMPAVLAGDDRVAPASGEVGADDLESFGAELFLDRHLVPNPQVQSTSGHALLSTAFDRAYVQNKRLLGVHSLLFADEVALISVADAVQAGWRPGATDMPAPPPATPALAAADRSGFAECELPRLDTVAPPSGPVSGGTVVRLTGAGFAHSGEVSVAFGSAAATGVEVLNDADIECMAPPAGGPGSVGVSITNRRGTASKPGAFAYRQEVTTQPALPASESEQEFDSAALLAIHHALVAFCQARMDVVAILTLPRHFGKRQCLEWHESLRERLGLPRSRMSFGDRHDLTDLSYASAYHPWLLVPDPTAPGMRAAPCDGAVCGMIARRERDRHAWVAPANVPLDGVFGLATTLPETDVEELFARQLNLIRREPRDFRAMSAHTLSDERALLQISVRRLMILLRKIAVERGMDYVFETNHERFREGVRLALEEMLTFLFARGAFAGAVPQEAFRVVTDRSVNPPQAVDRGRFIAEIRVAPSQPLEFITVQLMRLGDSLLQAAEA